MTAGPQSVARRLVARMLRPQPTGDRALIAGEFDRAFYLRANPDVAAARVDPLEHFLEYGWREGRDPSPRFSVLAYLDRNPDVAEAGINPLIHYLRNGRVEGRGRSHDLGFRYDVIRRLGTVEEQIADTLKAQSGEAAGSLEALIRGLSRSRTGLRDLHVTFSHDDFRANVGGVQLCLHREAARLAELGRDHLHIHPVVHWPVMRSAAEEGRLEVLLNGDGLGTYAPRTIAAALAKACPPGPGERSFAIHSLLGHTAEETAEIVEAAGLKAGFFWLHDYASLCAGFNLLRNGVEDCGAPPPDSAACGICVFGPARDRHLSAHETLFRRVRLTVVSPAERPLALWRESWDFPVADMVVHPHAQLAPRGPAPLPTTPRPLRIAFVGHPVAHKGWAIFRDLVVRHEDDPRYDFLHFGANTEGGLPLEFHLVRVTAEQPRAMLEALEKHEADVVLFWPLWRETFSFTVYEAIAAGCSVITGPDSGNVAAVVSGGDHGWVLPSEAALVEAFASGTVASLGRVERKPTLYDLTLSGMTIDLLGARADA